MNKILSVIIVLFILCISLFCPSFADAAQPVISNVSGTIVNGQNLTIKGFNMVDEDRTNWDFFFTKHPNASGFEGSSPTSDGYIMPNAPGTRYWWEPWYDTSVKLMGNQSIHYHTQGASPSILKSYVAMSHGLPSTGDIWVRLYAKWVFNINPYSHIKMIDTFGGAYQQYFQPGTNFQNMVATNHATFLSGTPTPLHKGDDIYHPVSGGIQQDRWYEFEIHFKNTSGQPYIFDTWMDGEQITWGISKNAAAFRTLMLGIINQRQKNENAVMDHWWDGYAVSSTRIYPASVIEIGNSSTYGQGTINRQEPRYLSDGSVIIKINIKGLGSGPLYLWVTNNRQERSLPYNLGKLH